jgi:hypothetical protein
VAQTVKKPKPTNANVVSPLITSLLNINIQLYLNLSYDIVGLYAVAGRIFKDSATNCHNSRKHKHKGATSKGEYFITTP